MVTNSKRGVLVTLIKSGRTGILFGMYRGKCKVRIVDSRYKQVMKKGKPVQYLCNKENLEVFGYID